MKRNFVYLLVLTIVAVLLLIFGRDQSSHDGQGVERLFVPGLSAEINNVERIEVVTAGQQVVVSLKKTTEAWLLEQMGYQADWPKLRILLADLAQARVVESKTDKPEYYSRLGVEDISLADAGGVLLRLYYGGEQTEILVGNAPEGRTGRYVRLQDEATSLLIDRNIEVSNDPLEWMNTEIVDVGASEVAEVEIIHPDGERVFVTRISADQTDFDLVGLPQDREVTSSWAVNSLGSVFSMLNLEAVQVEQDVDWTEAVKLRLLMFSGVEFLADLTSVDDTYYLRVKASHPAAAVVSDSMSETDQQSTEAQAMNDIRETVERINSRVAGWAYGIAKHKYDAMVKKPEDILKPLESP